MKIICTVLAVTLLAGCSLTLGKATSLIWNVYGAKCAVPKIQFEIADQNGCLVYDQSGGPCRQGFYDREPNEIRFAISSGQHLHDTALPHELLHAALQCRNGDADAEHVGTAWGAELESTREIMRAAGY